MTRAWQTGPHEVLVVDGGSRDDTAARAASAGARVLTSERGRALQQNCGARHATGEVLLFLHADCWLAPTGMGQLQQRLACPKIHWGAFRQQIEAPGAIYRLLEAGNAARVRWRGLPYGDQGIFVRRETFEAAGRFPEVRLMEDVLLMRKLRRLARPVLLEGPLHISPRRWVEHGPLRQTLRNTMLLAAARLGVAPNRLAEFYRPHDER